MDTPAPSRIAGKLLRKIAALTKEERFYVLEGLLLALGIDLRDEPDDGLGEFFAMLDELDQTPGGRMELAAQLARVGRSLEVAATAAPGASFDELVDLAETKLDEEDGATREIA